MHGYTRVVDLATSRFVAMKTVQTRRCRIHVDAWIASDIDETVVAKTAKALHDGKIDWSKLAIGAKTIIIGARAQLRKQKKVISADVIIREGWSAVTLRRVP